MKMRAIGFREEEKKVRKMSPGFTKIFEDLTKKSKEYFTKLEEIKDDLEVEIKEVKHVEDNLIKLEKAVEHLKDLYHNITDMWFKLVAERDIEKYDPEKIMEKCLKLRDIFSKFIVCCEELIDETKRYVITESYEIYRRIKVGKRKVHELSKKAKVFIFKIENLKNNMIEQNGIINDFMDVLDEEIKEIKKKKIKEKRIRGFG